MEWTLKYDTPPNEVMMDHQDKLLLTGSCFTEHIGNNLGELKFDVLQNPHGILFDTLSVCRSLEAYTNNETPMEGEFFLLNEAWHHWNFHSTFSHPLLSEAVNITNLSVSAAHTRIQEAKWLVVTLGSSFAYKLSAASPFGPGKPVANCHKAPAPWFTKYLIPVEEQLEALMHAVQSIRKANSGLNIIFTVSPVRHIRDGVVENNRSKARLIEVVHTLAEKMERVYYFPAYELVIDVLRDYRFYDIDLVHPNHAATQYVLEQFMKSFVNPASRKIAERLKPVITAMKHKAFHPQSVAHAKFLLLHLEKTQQLQRLYPHINFARELAYFGNATV
jgi:hypothetical protein